MLPRLLSLFSLAALLSAASGVKLTSVSTLSTPFASPDGDSRLCVIDQGTVKVATSIPAISSPLLRENELDGASLVSSAESPPLKAGVACDPFWIYALGFKSQPNKLAPATLFRKKVGASGAASIVLKPGDAIVDEKGSPLGYYFDSFGINMHGLSTQDGRVLLGATYVRNLTDQLTRALVELDPASGKVRRLVAVDKNLGSLFCGTAKNVWLAISGQVVRVGADGTAKVLLTNFKPESETMACNANSVAVLSGGKLTSFADDTDAATELFSGDTIGNYPIAAASSGGFANDQTFSFLMDTGGNKKAAFMIQNKEGCLLKTADELPGGTLSGLFASKTTLYLAQTEGLGTLLYVLKVTDYPRFTAASVTNGASFVPGMSPGSLITIFGTTLTFQEKPVGASSVPLPRKLAGTQVLFNGAPAPLTYVSQEQINLQAPIELPDTGKATMQINTTDQDGQIVYGSTVEVTLAKIQPALFEADSGPIVQHNSDGSLNSADNPIEAGGYVILYATGLGRTIPEIPSGEPSPFDPLAQLAETQVEIGVAGQRAYVSFAGLTPGYVGLYQINVQVPITVDSGEQEILLVVNGHATKKFKVYIK